MLQGLGNLETKHKVKLTVHLIARGVKRTKIVEICNVSFQAVYDYCDRHYEEFAPLIDLLIDSIITMKSKHIADKAQERLFLYLKDTEKKDLFALNTISGTHIDKMRLLSDKSTQNISIDAIRADIKELGAREDLLEGQDSGYGSWCGYSTRRACRGRKWRVYTMITGEKFPIKLRVYHLCPSPYFIGLLPNV